MKRRHDDTDMGDMIWTVIVLLAIVGTFLYLVFSPMIFN